MASFPAAFLQEIQFHAFPIDCLYVYRPIGAGGARGSIALQGFNDKSINGGSHDFQVYMETIPLLSIV